MKREGNPKLSRIRYGARRFFVHLALLTLFAAGAPAAAQDVRIFALGDSLTAGYGLPQGQGFVPQLERALRRNGVRAYVTDAGVSGDTAAQGRARLAWALDNLEQKPDLAIVALGANDMLRGLDPAQTRAELVAILDEFRRRNIQVVLAGMLAAPNWGPDYGAKFNAIYPDLARRYGALLYPFFLTGVTGERAHLLEDQLHPNFLGIKRMVTGMVPVVLKALGR